jgi:undecaprenyl-diphosphatase
VSPTLLVLTALGALVLGGSVQGARHPTIPAREQQAFRALNGLPDALYWPLWLPMQMGNLVVGTAVGLGVAAAESDLSLGIGVVVAAAAKLVAERVLRHEMHRWLTVRQRPGTSEPGAVLRGGDVPVSGPSFPSGHVVLVAALATTLGPALPAWAVWSASALVVVVMVGRVYVGAHNPLDVTAGAGLGLVVGSVVALSIS